MFGFACEDELVLFSLTIFSSFLNRFRAIDCQSIESFKQPEIKTREAEGGITLNAGEASV